METSSLTFDEVKVVWNKVIPAISSHINVAELVDDLRECFTQSTIQKIEAQRKQSGDVEAARIFFDEARRKPNSFITVLVTLKKTFQEEVLVEILKSVKNNITAEGRSEEIFEELRRKAASSGVNVEHEITSARNGNNGRFSNGQATGGQVNDTSTPQRSRVESPSSSSSPDSPESNTHVPNPGPVPRQQKNNTSSEEVILYQRPHNETFIPKPGPVAKKEATPESQGANNTHQILQKSAPKPGVSLESLKPSARKKISDKLKEKHPEDEEERCIWEFLLDEEDDLNIAASQASAIENSRNPEKAFYDELMKRGYDTEALINILMKHKCKDAAETVLQHSEIANTSRGTTTSSFPLSPPPPYKEDLEQFDENNLNAAIQKTTNLTDKQIQQGLNIPAMSTRQGNLTGTGSRQSSPTIADSRNVSQPVEGECHETNVRTELTNSSLESITDNTKGTKAIEAVGDRENKQSTLDPESERAELIQDRVRQHEKLSDTSNLQSINDVRGKASQENYSNAVAEDGQLSHDFTSVTRLQDPQICPQPPTGSSNSAGSQNQSTGIHVPSQTNPGTSVTGSGIDMQIDLNPDSYSKVHSDESIELPY